MSDCQRPVRSARGLDFWREIQDDRRTSPTGQPTLGDLLAKRLNRRGALQGLLAAGVMAGVGVPLSNADAQSTADTHSSFDFQPVPHGVDATHHVADGHATQVLLRWGDPLFPDAPAFDPMRQSPEAQARQFGYNNDFIGLIPLPGRTDTSEAALLVVNHEYTNEDLMFPEVAAGPGYAAAGEPTPQRIRTEMAAHGGSIVEIRRSGAQWQVVREGPFNRRITAETPHRLSGPAAGHDRLKTAEDPTGTAVRGTLNNCAGGITPWGTWLMAEENFHGYFLGDPAGHPEQAKLARYGIPGGWYDWGLFEPRFDISLVPQEPNRFGWVVEVDPFDPASLPVKRTALGRFKHEGAECVVNPADGRLVVFMGDDQRFDYVYRFVSRDPVNLETPQANRDLLDHGTLSVARFNEGGEVVWLPLIHGQGPLTAANGFTSQADVLIDTRLAADLMGATPMDRPEDVEPDLATGRIHIMLTNNSRREKPDAANPRADNRFGHIVQMQAPGRDFGADIMGWEMLVVCGDPSIAAVGARWAPGAGDGQWFACPDNCALDHRGRLWVATDQGRGWGRTGVADGLYALEVAGQRRGEARQLFRVPVGAELCGPRFASDDRSLFVAVQHPGADGAKDFPGFERDSTFADPATRWPDFVGGMPPRPSVVVIRRDDGATVG